jgi:hypothetical protein
MLFAKIFPEAMIASLNGPFSLETSTAQYMTAIANPYKLGDYTVNFNIYYGDFVLDELDNPISFQVKLTNNAVIDGATVQSWGTDDTYMLNAIAIQQGTTVVEFIENDISVSLY